VSPPVHENQLSKSNKLDAEAIWLYILPPTSPTVMLKIVTLNQTIPVPNEFIVTKSYNVCMPGGLCFKYETMANIAKRQPAATI
jgi:hypothetical protein